MCFQLWKTTRGKLVGHHALDVVLKSENVNHSQRPSCVCKHFNATAIWSIIETHRRLFIVGSKSNRSAGAKKPAGACSKGHYFTRRRTETRNGTHVIWDWLILRERR